MRAFAARCSALAVAAAIAVSASISSSARAEAPPPPDRINVDTAIGYGFAHGQNDPPNIFGFGVGLRGGATFSSGFYVGAVYVAHAGYAVDTVPTTGTGPAVGRRTMVGAEVGYEWETPVLFRIYTGVGGLLDRGADRGATGALVKLGTTSDVGFWPGVSVRYPLPMLQRFVVGGDVHLTLPGESNAPVGFEVAALFGTRFAAPW